MALYPPWMQRLAEFADETCLSQGDLLRVTEDMIDAKTGVIRLNSGRGETGVEQIPPLTQRCQQILAEIEADRKQPKRPLRTRKSGNLFSTTTAIWL